MPSTRASQLASMMFSDTPTVPLRACRSSDTLHKNHLTRAAIPVDAGKMARGLPWGRGVAWPMRWVFVGLGGKRTFSKVRPLCLCGVRVLRAARAHPRRAGCGKGASARPTHPDARTPTR